MASDHKPSLLISLLRMKCPSCRKGRVFVNKSIFPLGKLVDMVPNCSVCGQKMVNEQNNGGGINYALTVVLFFLNLAWYVPIFGMSYKDNSVENYLWSSTLVVLLVQPWLMRLSRMIYLYLYIPYGKTRFVKDIETLDDGK